MYYQTDKQWSRLRWYDPSMDAVVSALTDAVHAQPNSDLGVEGEDCTLGESGCWHVSVASMLSNFGQAYGVSLFTPESFLRALRDEGMGTLTGYVSRPFVDPMSIVTNGKVQLYAFRDFGSKGVGSTSSELKQILDIVGNERFCAIINVQSHEFFGKKNSHYVMVYKAQSSGYVMHDPDSKTNKSLFNSYKRIFQVTVYQCRPQ